MAKIRYEVDPHNRLIVRGGEGKTEVRMFRYAIDGRFEIGRGNELLYHIKAPSRSPIKELNLPHQLFFKGNWSLTKDHNLKLTIDKWYRRTFGDEITLKGEIIKVDTYSLAFAVTQKTKENAASTYILKFEGGWQADRNNRLVFRIKRETERHDSLVFEGIWEVDRKNMIVYSYERRSSYGGQAEGRHSLSLNGFWNYNKRGMLTYRFDLLDKTGFDFRIGNAVAENNRIEFELGIGISRRKSPVKKYIILYGNWAVKNGVGLIFEAKIGGQGSMEMKFGAEAELSGDSRIKFALKNENGRDMGMELMLSKDMLGGSGESFIRFLGSRREKAVYIGSGFIW